ncbi:MAG: glutaredoxin family protein [Dehalococcoidia bacterium]|nr:glutaredoxin family protein [Dehalococcoidia bacterium]
MSVKEHIKHVSGSKKRNVTLYTLSTCGWCKKTKSMLNDMKMEYDYVDVDLLQGDDKEEALGEVRKWNPACSFPTMVIDDNRCIVGFKEDEIKRLA